MFLKNFWDYMRINMQTGFQNSNSIYGYPTTIVDIEGNSLPYLATANFGNYTFSANYKVAAENYCCPFRGFKVVVGSGDTPADADDYNLETEETSNFTGVSYNVMCSVSETGKFLVTASWSGTNNTDSPITIKEIGLEKRFALMTANNNTNLLSGLHWVLCARYILPNPITINPGDGTTITIEFESN